MATWDELQEVGSRWRSPRDGIVRRVIAVDHDPYTMIAYRYHVPDASNQDTFGYITTNSHITELWVRVSEFEPGDIVTWAHDDYEVRFVDTDGMMVLRSLRVNRRICYVHCESVRRVRKADR